MAIEIRELTNAPDVCNALSETLIETVARGGSVGFMHPLAIDDARAFWSGALAAAQRAERIVLGAYDAGELAATITVLLALPPNQPHRAELAKVMTRVRYRGRGIATALVHAAEAAALRHGRTLLVLDTAVEEGASALYERLGYTYAGTIPDYALKPHGGLTGTMLYWKRIGIRRS